MVRQHVHVVTLAQRHQAQVAELAPREPPVGKFAQRAQVVPAQAGEVLDGLGVTGARAEPERQVPAKVGADGGEREPAYRQDLSVA